MRRYCYAKFATFFSGHPVYTHSVTDCGLSNGSKICSRPSTYEIRVTVTKHWRNYTKHTESTELPLHNCIISSTVEMSAGGWYWATGLQTNDNTNPTDPNHTDPKHSLSPAVLPGVLSVRVGDIVCDVVTYYSDTSVNDRK